MLSLEFIRDNKQKVIEAVKNKNREADIDKILELDDARRATIVKIDALRQERNANSKNHDESTITRGKEIKELLKDLETKLTEVETELNKLVSFVPNVPLDEVPVGHDEKDNVEIKKHGTIPEFDFIPLSHTEIIERLNIADLERGSKVAGYRGYFLKNQLALLHMGIMMYAMQKLSASGYTPIIAPSIVKGFTLFGTAQFPWGEPEVYKLNDEDAYLAGTAEVAVTSYHSGEILNEKDLPKKYVAFSPCFRREVGSYGKDTKGLYRVHEFWKIEQVIIGKNDIEESKKLHEELQQNSEQLLQDLELPYRVLLMCTGDMGEPQMKKYDTEAWMPSRNGYGETMSNSIMGDYQARRLNIKYRTKDNKTLYAHTLNNTAIASPRILIALLENHQQKDGSIRIPKALQPIVGFEKIEVK
jgi:seryl-tRNA synthetase